MDASFIRKSGSATFGFDKFWNGCPGKAEKGLEASIISLIDVKENAALCLTVDLRRAEGTHPGSGRASKNAGGVLRRTVRKSRRYYFAIHENRSRLTAFMPSRSLRIKLLRRGLWWFPDYVRMPIWSIFTGAHKNRKGDPAQVGGKGWLSWFGEVCRRDDRTSRSGTETICSSGVCAGIEKRNQIGASFIEKQKHQFVLDRFGNVGKRCFQILSKSVFNRVFDSGCQTVRRLRWLSGTR